MDIRWFTMTDKRSIEDLWNDWENRLQSALLSKGHESLLSLSNSLPLATIEDIIIALGGNFSPIQLQWRFVDEATSPTVARSVAFSLLVRFLRSCAGGWPGESNTEGMSALHHALIEWRSSIPDSYRSNADKIAIFLMKNPSLFAPGHMPTSDDPTLHDVFKERWPQ